MKRVGPGGTRIIYQRTLRLTVSAEKLEPRAFCEPIGPIFREPVWRIEFHFGQMVNDLEVQGMTIIMEARQNSHDEDRWRDELLQSRYLETVAFSSESHQWYESKEPITVEILDPLKIMPWLFPHMDVADFFNQSQTSQKQLNDKPVRLPASRS